MCLLVSCWFKVVLMFVGLFFFLDACLPSLVLFLQKRLFDSNSQLGRENNMPHRRPEHSKASKFQGRLTNPRKDRHGVGVA